MINLYLIFACKQIKWHYIKKGQMLLAMNQHKKRKARIGYKVILICSALLMYKENVKNPGAVSLQVCSLHKSRRDRVHEI